MIQPKIFRNLLLLILVLSSTSVFSQSIPSSQLFHELLKLKETKRVLYVAAHPDDENTRLIAYLANGEHMEVAYLSVTRGDGGQNLIGKELGVELGQIRTQELLKARQTDGGRQFFTRGTDFGYSKNPTETLQNWDKEKILGDVVWAIRRFQPDIIITRFNTIPGVTHGHHTTSAILAGEAFTLAGNPKAYPDQLKYVSTWEPKRIFFNAYNFGGEFTPEEGKKYHVFEVGGYDPLLGKTFHQIAADSRTMHKSQGFGATAGTGQAKDYIEQVGGEPFQASPFEGIKDRWESIPGGLEVKKQLDQLIQSFNFKDPEENLQKLLSFRKSLHSLTTPEPWVALKKEQLDQLIFRTLGLEFEFIIRKEFGFPGETVKGELIFNNPSTAEISKISLQGKKKEYTIQSDKLAVNNQTVSVPVEWKISDQEPYSQPYWLEKPIAGAMYDVDDQAKIGLPFNQDFPQAILSFSLGEQLFKEPIQLFYKYNDQVDGEVKQPFTIVPEVDLLLSKENVFLVPGADPTVTVTVSFREQFLEGELEFEGIEKSQYRILSIEDIPFQKKRVYQVSFLPNGPGKKVIQARFITPGGKVFDQITQSISYKHIPNLTYFRPALVNLIQETWKVSGAKIGYIPGAGDEVPGVLAALGYQVIPITEKDYSVDYLSQFKAIVVGIRAYNTNEALAANQQVLMGYVRSGGNLIVQYNTSSPLLTNQLGPYPFTIGRDRVTVQDSEVQADWGHPVLAGPNKISAEDFQGWVQERGLYFATQIDPQYQTPLQMQDPNEPSSSGALVFGNYGEGHFVYTGISFFRQLPAGVPGAIKIFVNMIEQ